MGLGRLLCALIFVAAASAAEADSVLLANGNRFDDVLAAVESDGAVTVRFSYGEITLPPAMVVRVEEAESGLAAYLEEYERLETACDTSAGDWLELALGARAGGLGDGYRRAVRRAAELEPALPALAPHMRALGMVLDARRGTWLPAAEARAAQREARREVERPSAAFEASARAAERERRRLIDAIELLALAELAEELEESRREPAPPAMPVYTTSVVFFPRAYRTAEFHASYRPAATEHNRRTMEGLVRRQPGSLLPVVSKSAVPGNYVRALPVEPGGR